MGISFEVWEEDAGSIPASVTTTTVTVVSVTQPLENGKMEIRNGTLFYIPEEDFSEEEVAALRQTLPVNWNVSDCEGIGSNPDDRYKHICICGYQCTSGSSPLVTAIEPFPREERVAMLRAELSEARNQVERAQANLARIMNLINLENSR